MRIRWTTLLLVALAACAGRGPAQVTSLEEVAPEQLYQTGVALLARGDLTRAEQYLVSALRGGYDERQTLKALILTTVRASRLRSALTYAGPYLAQHPRETALRQLVASIHLALGELAQAERELGRVLAAEETSPEAHYLMARVLAERGAPAQEQRAELARYLELAPQGAHAEEARAEF